MFEKLRNKIKKELEVDRVDIEIPKFENGDITIPCFSLGKEKGLTPVEIAKKVSLIVKDLDIVHKVVVKGPYVNIFLNWKKIDLSINNFLFRKKKKILIEFSSPNINKPLHLGHLRNMVIGDSVARMLEFQGNSVKKLNLINDKGLPIAETILEYLLREREGKKVDLSNGKADHIVGELYVSFKKRLENHPELEEEAREILRRMENGDKEILSVWSLLRKRVLEGFEETYNLLGIKFDKYEFESDIYTKGKDVVLKGLEKGIFEKGEDGEIYANLESFSLPNKVVLRKDGTSLYITQDIYLAIKRFEEENFDSLIYVVADEQNLHFKQLFAILMKMGYKWASRLKHLSYGMILLEGGKMKSREGKVVDADNLLQEVIDLAKEELKKRYNLEKDELEKRARIIGIGSLKFFLAKYRPTKSFVYRPEEGLKFEGETGPYIQYTYARLRSILRKAASIEKKSKKKLGRAKEELDIAISGEERVLPYSYLYFVNSLNSAIEKMDPSLICHSLISLCENVNSFYHKHRIIGSDNEDTLLYLIEKISDIIKLGLSLLGIDTLEEM